MLTYEISFVVIPVIYCLAWIDRLSFKDFVKKTIPYTILISIYAIITLILRHKFSSAIYDGTSFGNISQIPSTFIQQTIATLPLNSLLFDNPNRYHIAFSKIIVSSLILVLISISAFLKLFPSITLDKEAIKKINAVGLCFLLVPALMISCSFKYQNWLFSSRIGFGYLPIYMQ